jgi:hypothetical protein
MEWIASCDTLRDCRKIRSHGPNYLLISSVFKTLRFTVSPVSFYCIVDSSVSLDTTYVKP